MRMQTCASTAKLVFHFTLFWCIEGHRLGTNIMLSSFIVYFPYFTCVFPPNDKYSLLVFKSKQVISLVVYWITLFRYL